MDDLSEPGFPTERFCIYIGHLLILEIGETDLEGDMYIWTGS